jgi:hypothetical protein
MNFYLKKKYNKTDIITLIMTGKTIIGITINFTTVDRFSNNNDGYGFYWQDVVLNQKMEMSLFLDIKDAIEWIFLKLMENGNRREIIPRKFYENSNSNCWIKNGGYDLTCNCCYEDDDTNKDLSFIAKKYSMRALGTKYNSDTESDTESDTDDTEPKNELEQLCEMLNEHMETYQGYDRYNYYPYKHFKINISYHNL